MKRIIAILSSITLLTISSCSATNNTPTPINPSSQKSPVSSINSIIVSEQDNTITFDLTSVADKETPLRNPDKGWYIHYYDNGIDRYGILNGVALSPEQALNLVPCLDHIYLRLSWAYLEPEEGKFNWELIDKIIDPYTAAGIGITFRISCKETDVSQNGGYDTPKWVFDAGAKYELSQYDSIEPDYGDPIFLKKLDNFHKAFAKRYDGRSNLIYIDVGSYGDWGEGHTAFSSHKDWPWETIKVHFDIHKKHYKNTLICISDDFIGSRNDPEGKEEILQYVLDNGWTFRDDSIGDSWHFQTFGTSMRSPELFDAVWNNAPTILENGHYQGTIENNTWRKGQLFDKAIIQSHATYGGFHGYPLQWVADNYKYARKAGNKLGYWYFINKVSVKKNNNSLNIYIDWFNDGAAKAYNKYGFDIILTDKAGNETVYTQKSFDNTLIMPGKSTTTKHALNGIKSGEYTLSVRMYKGDRPVFIAVDKKYVSDNGACKIGKIKI